LYLLDISWGDMGICKLELLSILHLISSFSNPYTWKLPSYKTSHNSISNVSISIIVNQPFLSVFWIPGYPGPPAPGPRHQPIFSPGENQRPKLRKRPSWGGASWGERRPKLLRTRRPPHEPPLVRRGTTSASAQHVGMQSKKIRDRRLRTAHATPDREETNFRCACPKRHSGCWPPP
jgi:hypothetical protein